MGNTIDKVVKIQIIFVFLNSDKRDDSNLRIPKGRTTLSFVKQVNEILIDLLVKIYNLKDFSAIEDKKDLHYRFTEEVSVHFVVDNWIIIYDWIYTKNGKMVDIDYLINLIPIRKRKEPETMIRVNNVLEEEGTEKENVILEEDI